MSSKIIQVTSKDGIKTTASIERELFAIVCRDFESSSACTQWIRQQASEIAKGLGMSAHVSLKCLHRVTRPELLNPDNMEILKIGPVVPVENMEILKIQPAQPVENMEILKIGPVVPADPSVPLEPVSAAIVSEVDSVESEFLELWKLYPKRAGGNPKGKALKLYRKQVKKHPAAEIKAGVERYAAFCLATDKVGTEYVMQAKRFLGPDLNWQDNYAAPAIKRSAFQKEKDNINQAAASLFADARNTQPNSFDLNHQLLDESTHEQIMQPDENQVSDDIWAEDCANERSKQAYERECRQEAFITAQNKERDEQYARKAMEREAANTVVEGVSKIDRYIDRLWKTYPKKQDRKQSIDRLRKLAVKNNSRPQLAEILNHVRLRRRIHPDGQYWPTLDRMIREEKYRDEIPGLGMAPKRIVDIYHRVLPGNPEYTELTPADRENLGRLWDRLGRTNQRLTDYFKYCATQGYLVGRGRDEWRASLSFLVNPDKFSAICSGETYTDKDCA